jgi:hypothetical protein
MDERTKGCMLFNIAGYKLFKILQKIKYLLIFAAVLSKITLLTKKIKILCKKT